METRIYWDGKFLSNAALFTLFETTLPFYVFQTQHFMPTDKKLVITGADPARRLVTEINAEPAAWEYADAPGIAVNFNRKFVDMWRIPEDVIASRDDDKHARLFVLDSTAEIRFYRSGIQSASGESV